MPCLRAVGVFCCSTCGGVPPCLFCSASHNMHQLDPGVMNHHPHGKLDDFPKPTRSGTRRRPPCKSVAHSRGIDTQPAVPHILHLADGEQHHMPTGLSISIPAAKQCSCYLQAPNVSAAWEYEWTNRKSSVTLHLKPQDSSDNDDHQGGMMHYLQKAKEPG